MTWAAALWSATVLGPAAGVGLLKEALNGLVCGEVVDTHDVTHPSIPLSARGPARKLDGLAGFEWDQYLLGRWLLKMVRPPTLGNKCVGLLIPCRSQEGHLVNDCVQGIRFTHNVDHVLNIVEDVRLLSVKVQHLVKVCPTQAGH
jgi:hypothetical protein